MKNNPIVYILINGELNMSPGKAAAQAAHAMASLNAVNFGVGEDKVYPCIEDFSRHVTRTVLVLEAKNTQQILNLHKYLQDIGILSEYYIDEGVNEVDVYSVTALAVGPIWAGEAEKREVLRSFPLYPAKKKRWWKK